MKRFCILLTCMAMLSLSGCASFSAFGTQISGSASADVSGNDISASDDETYEEDDSEAETETVEETEKEINVSEISFNKEELKMTKGEEVTVPLEGIVLSDLELEYNPQTTYQLSVLLTPEDTTDEVNLTYTSSDTDIVAVDPLGGLHTTGTGTVEITVTTGDFEETCAVTVVSPLKKLVLSEEEISINLGENTQLMVTPSPDNTTDEINLVFESSDESVVSVDSDGVITALAPGSAQITVTSGDVSATCTVDVSVPLEGIELSDDGLQLEKGSTAALTATLLPENTTEEADITYTSSNTAVVTVDANGNISAVGAGSAVITASAGAFTDSCTVNVTAKLNAIGLDKTDITIYTGGSAYLNVSYSPVDTTDDKSAIWTSSDNGVATVNNGTVTAVGTGTCTVTATVGAFSASCIVRVKTLAATSGTSTSGKVIVLDPGHGGIDPGASSGNLVEKDMTLKVALYCKEYLEANYTGMTVLLTRTTDTQLAVDETGTDLRSRCQYAASVGADIMVSLHFNGTDTHTSQGALAIISKQSNVNSACTTLANSILAQLSALGLGNRGTLIKSSDTLFDANGVSLDYYAINRVCATYGIPGIIIEHCFMDNAYDATFCDSDEDLRQLGIADAIGIANALGLSAK